jgi:hypothetical protein
VKLIDTNEAACICQARHCTSPADPEVVLLRLNPAQQGGLEVRVCAAHRGKLQQLADQTKPKWDIDQEGDDE